MLYFNTNVGATPKGRSLITRDPCLIQPIGLKRSSRLADLYTLSAAPISCNVLLCDVRDQLTLCFAINSRTSGMRSTGTSIAV